MEIKQQVIPDYVLKTLEQFNTETNLNLTYADLFRLEDKLQKDLFNADYRANVFTKANELFKKLQNGTGEDKILLVASKVSTSIDKQTLSYIPDFEITDYKAVNKALNFIATKFTQDKITDKADEYKERLIDLLYSNYIEEVKALDNHDLITFDTVDRPNYIGQTDDGIDTVQIFENQRHLEIFVKNRSQHSDFFPTEITLDTFNHLEDIKNTVHNKYDMARILEGKLEQFEKFEIVDKPSRKNKITI